MENITQNLINVLNILAQISTRGDDTIRMGSALVELRRVINEAQQSSNANAAEDDNNDSSVDL